jgi:antitoxin CcdA
MRIYYTHGGYMTSLYNTSAPKKPTNLTVNTDLLSQAKELKINISSVLEKALILELQKRKHDSWKIENKEAISEYNSFISENGILNDDLGTI